MSRARSAALVLVVAVAVFAVPSLALIATEDSFVADVSPVRSQIAKLIRKKEEIKLIALGDSHAALGFYSESPAAHSLAYAGEGVKDMAVRVGWLLKSLPNVRKVAIELQPHLFFPDRVGVRGTATIATTDGASASERMLVRLSDQFHPCCRGAASEWLVRKTLGLRKPPEAEVLPNGYMLYNQVRKPLKPAADAEIDSYQGGTSALAELQIEFAAIVRVILDRGIDVALVRYPLSVEYRERLGFAAFEEAATFERSLLAANPKLTSCGAWDWFSNKPMMFLNSDHLTLEGAKAYWQPLGGCLGVDKPE